MCTATGVFEMFDGGVLGPADNFDAAFGIESFLCRNSSGVITQVVVDD